MKWYEASMMVRNIHITRYVASYYIGGGIQSYPLAKKWAKQLIIDGSNLTEDEASLIADCICNGKLELQDNIKIFMNQYNGLDKYDILDMLEN